MHAPRVLADLPVSPVVTELLGGRVELVPWNDRTAGSTRSTPTATPPWMRRCSTACRALKVISNFGVGVDHIDVRPPTAAASRSATRRAFSTAPPPTSPSRCCSRPGGESSKATVMRAGPNFTRYDPSYMLGREVHGSTLGIFGMGRIGRQVARRARGFGMTVLYHNRNRSDEAEVALGARYVDEGRTARDRRLRRADGAAHARDTRLHRPGGTGEDEADRDAGQRRPRRGRGQGRADRGASRAKRIYAAALDVTDPEPLPRDHPLLKLDNVIITPHLGSATEETRRKMAEISVENLFAGLDGRNCRSG